MSNGIKVLWVISVSAAFFLGFAISSRTTLNNTSQLIEQPKINNNNIQAKENIQLSSMVKLKKSSTAVLDKPDLNVLVDNLTSLLGSGQFSLDMASIAEAYGLIENLTEDELMATLNLVKGDLSKPNNMQLLSLLTGRLATFDPLKAVDFIEKNVAAPQAKMTAMMSALSSWVKNDPESAYYWYIDPNNGHDSNNMFSSMGLLSIFNGLASKNANGAFDKLAELDRAGRDTMMAAMGFSQSLKNKEDFVQFIERSDELDNIKIKKSIISSWVLKNPLETIEWSDSIEEQGERKKLQETIFTTWSSIEPTNAANWYIEKTNESDKESRAANIIQMWSMKDPNAALSWLDQQATFDTQKTTVKLLNSSTYSNPKFAIDNLDRLTSTKDKADVSFSIYQSLARSSSKKAEAFLASSPYKKEIAKQQQTFEKYRTK